MTRNTARHKFAQSNAESLCVRGRVCSAKFTLKWPPEGLDREREFSLRGFRANCAVRRFSIVQQSLLEMQREREREREKKVKLKRLNGKERDAA